MALKTDARSWTVMEQVVEDPASGLTFQFEVVPDTTAKYRLRIFGDLPFGNLEIIFNEQGEEAGAGTLVAGLCKPSWLCALDD